MKKKRNWGDNAHWVFLPKLYRIMRLLCLLMIVGLMQVSAASFSQNSKLNLNLKNLTIEDVLGKIEDQTDYSFFYNSQKVDLSKVVNIEVKDESIEEVLNLLMDETGLSYTVNKKLIIIHQDNSLSQNGLIAQTLISVKGKVIDTSGAPLPGVTVVVKGTTNGTITDFDGVYTLTEVTSDAIIQFSFVGMKMQDISVDGRTSINVTMEEDAIGIEEVVAIGYGTMKKSDITGSISSISGDKVGQKNTQSLTQAMQGQTAGVYVRSNSGQPGGGVSVRIRGIGGINDSEPLYIIDGIQRVASGSDSQDPLSFLNPNDIESIEILKDASSSAIYGARAANGVVLITTKRGKNGAPHLTYKGSVGFQNVTNPNNFGLLNAKQFAERVNATALADGDDPIFGGPNTTTYPVEYFPDPSNLGEGTDWLGAIMQKNVPMHEHQLSIEGGKEKHQYYVSFNYYDQEGIIVESGYKRYSLRVNTDNTINNWLKIGNSLSVSHSVKNGISAIRQFVGGDMYVAMRYSPAIPLYNEDGSYAGPPTAFYSPDRNPLARIKDVDRESGGTDMSANVYGEIKLLKDLNFRSSLSVTLGYSSWDTFAKSYSEGIASYDLSSHTYGTGKSNSWLWNNVLSYNKVFDKHNLSALAGIEASEGAYTSLEGSAKFTDDNIKVVRSNGAESDASFEEFITSSSLISYFGRLSYNYDSKYYIEGNIRRDGSSQFGINSRWGVFPSVSGAWRISKEDFFPKKLVNDMKLRAGYGEVGNNKIGNFSYIAPLTTVLYSISGNDGNFDTGLTVNSLANPDIKWETSKQLNFGVDLSLLRNKLSFTLEYFETKVEDMLLNVSFPAFTGISSSGAEINLASIISNTGSLTNTGFEIEIGYTDKIGDFSFAVNANLTTFKNEVTDIGDNEQIWGFLYDSNYLSRTIVGGSLGEFYGYVADGIFQTQTEIDAANSIDGDASTPFQNVNTAPGDFRYKDINGDDVIDSDDRATIGSPIPDFTYGFSLDCEYKNMEASILFTGTYGNEIFNANRMNLESSGERNYNKSKTVINAWNGPGTSNTIPRAIGSDPNQNKRPSSNFIEDGSYLRLRDIRLSYNIPKAIISKVKIENVKFYVSGQNLITFTNYSGFDPEVGNYNGSNLRAGVDTDIYPQTKSFHIGTVINF